MCVCRAVSESDIMVEPELGNTAREGVTTLLPSAAFHLVKGGFSHTVILPPKSELVGVRESIE